MNNNELFNQIRIPEPCSMSWAAMQGDDRIRHCAACGKKVHDFSSMTSTEVANVLQAHGGDICGTVYVRPDPTLVIGDRPPSLAAAPAPFQFSIRSLMAIIAGVAATPGFARIFAVSEQPLAPKPRATLNARIVGKVAMPPQRAASAAINSPSCPQPN
jgi:hypothetical protein